MLKEVRFPDRKNRPLNQKEKELIATMLADNPYANSIIEKLPFYRVKEMKDGKMGSLQFIQESEKDSLVSSPIAEAEYLDEDNITVSMVVNIDTDGELYELDMWKVDFSPLKRFPESHQIKLISK
jgi:hypothetical protein